MTDSTSPVIIEAAISPLRWNEPAQSIDQIVAQSLACIEAGAGIIHHHHDMRLAEEDGVAALVETGRRILDEFPDTLIYTDYLSGKRAWEENAHLKVMEAEGVLTLFAIDPGLTTFASYDPEGIPTKTYLDGLRFDEADEMVAFSKRANVPISLGVFEPGAVRWIRAYEEARGFSSGTMVKLYFGGNHMVDRPQTQGINFGLPATVRALETYLDMLEGSALPWTVSLFGDPILDSPLAEAALRLGGHLRVGEEDAAGMTTESNVELVQRAAAVAESCGRPLARGAEALRVLQGTPSA